MADKHKPKIVKREDGDYIEFTIPTGILQISQRRLQNRLMEIHHRQLRGRIEASEAKRLGRVALETAFEENVELFNRSARAQGFKEAPIRLINRERVEEEAKRWDDAVDRTAANLQPD